MDLKFQYALVALLTSLSTCGLAAYVYWKGRGQRLNRLYALWALSVSLWSACLYLSILTTSPSLATFWCRLLHVWATLIPVTYLHFVLAFVYQAKRQRWLIRALYASAAVVVSLIPTPWFLFSGYKPQFRFFVTEPQPLYPLHMALFMGCIAYATFVLMQTYLGAQGVKRKQFQYFLIATLIGYSGGITNYLINYGILLFPLYPFGNYTILAYVAVVGVGIVRYKLMDIEVIIKRTLVFAGLSGTVFGVVTLITFVLRDWLSPRLNIGQATATSISVVLIVLLFRPLETWLTNATNRFLFQKKYDYKHLLKQFADEAITVLDLKRLLASTTKLLAESLPVDACAILLPDARAQHYVPEAARGLPQDRIAITADSPLVTFLARTHEPLVRQEEEHFPPAIHQEMDRLHATLCLPLVVHEDLVGFISLSRKKSDEDYTQEDLDVLSTLAKAEAIAISNAQLAAEAAQQAKLAAIGTLAAAINHEVCNPLNNIRVRTEALLLELEQNGYTNLLPAQRQKFADLLARTIREVDNAAAITTRLATFAKPAREPVTERVDVRMAIRDAITMLEHDFELHGIRIVEECREPLPPILVDRKQLVQHILFNLIRNAGQAIGEQGAITVKAHSDQGRVIVQVIDTGPGIAQESLSKIFLPFFTTKGEGHGTGLGLFVVKNLVERNGGHIDVKSQLGVGSTFVVTFPEVA